MAEEVEGLLKEGITPERLISFGLEYRYLTEYLLNKITYEQMFIEILNKSKQFAKRQLTWLKRDESIIWKKFPVDTEELETEAKGFLNK
jgi:tRNA dimethylallyltransferase